MSPADHDPGAVRNERIEMLRGIVASDPLDALAWQMLGGELLRAQASAEAAEALQRAADLTGESTLAATWKLLGDAHRKSGNAEAARHAYTQAIDRGEATGDLQAAKEARALLAKL